MLQLLLHHANVFFKTQLRHSRILYGQFLFTDDSCCRRHHGLKLAGTLEWLFYCFSIQSFEADDTTLVTTWLQCDACVAMTLLQWCYHTSNRSTALEPCETHNSVAYAAMALEVLEQELKSAIIDIVASDTVRARRVQQQLVGFPRCTAKDSMHMSSSETIQGPELKSVITSKQFTVHIADFVQCVAGECASCSCSVDGDDHTQ